MAPHRLFLALLLTGCMAAEANPGAAPNAETPAVGAACVKPGVWADGRGQPLAGADLLKRAAAASAVLLGERHDDAEQHRWQFQTLAAIHALNPNLAIGLEMFPRAKQPVLDRWVAGELTEAAFLKESDWATVWGYDAQFYLPVLHFARMNRLPLVALNVDRALVARTGKEGWAAIPESEREGVGTPAAPSDAYLDHLAAVLAAHDRDGKNGKPDRDAPEFRRFVEAQSVWDRAMAERIAATHRDGGRTVVALMGAGHVQDRFGVPNQLADLGLKDALVLLPWDGARRCATLNGTIADAVFGLDTREAAASPKPRLGVLLEPTGGGVRIGKVQEGSIAAKAGFATGDVVVAAAGAAIRTPSDLTAIVQRQAPGTWLPVTVKRGRKERDLVAKFPAE
ncbi:MAG TPA: ChaN family lipoprotein [Azospirillum sp.]